MFIHSFFVHVNWPFCFSSFVTMLRIWNVACRLTGDDRAHVAAGEKKPAICVWNWIVYNLSCNLATKLSCCRLLQWFAAELMTAVVIIIFWVLI